MGGVNSGRGRKEIDMEAAIDLMMRGEPLTNIAPELGCSVPTLRSRIKEIQREENVLLQYREIQDLQLTSIQARILEAITPDKIEDAPLRDLVASFKILKDKESVALGKPTEIQGLVAHLILMEKNEAAIKAGKDPIIDITPDFEPDIETVPEVDLAEQLQNLDDSTF